MKQDLITKILLPTDGSGPSLEAARYAAQLAKCTGASVTVLYVTRLTGVGQFMAYSISSTSDLSEDLRKAGAEIIARTREALDNTGVHVDADIVEGEPAEAIVSEVREHGYDMVIMGSCGTSAGALKRIFLGLGSVAERVAANVPCSILIVRPLGIC